jgi:aminomethyltransferase
MGERTPLAGTHEALGARLVDFAGWEMPVQYPPGILREHAATREAAGLFDTCHMGEILVEGPDVARALNRVFAGDFTTLEPGRERYTFLTTETGGVIDDAVVMLRAPERAWVVVNAGRMPEKMAAVRERLPEGVAATDISAATGKLDLQGPAAHRVVEALFGTDLRRMRFYSFVDLEWNGAPLTLSRSGYTGEPGVELYIDAARVGELWEALRLAAEPFGGLPCGLGARDTLRLEAGLPLYGHEMDATRGPVEAGFGRLVTLDKPEDFPGKDALAGRMRRRGAGEGEVLVGLRMEGRRVPRQGHPVERGGAPVGEVTSGAPGPSVGAPVAMAYVAAPEPEAGTALAVSIRGKAAAAVVTPLPFYRNPDLRRRVED